MSEPLHVALGGAPLNLFSSVVQDIDVLRFAFYPSPPSVSSIPLISNHPPPLAFHHGHTKLSISSSPAPFIALLIHYSRINCQPLFVFNGLNLAREDRPFAKSDTRDTLRERAWEYYANGETQKATSMFNSQGSPFHNTFVVL